MDGSSMSIFSRSAVSVFTWACVDDFLRLGMEANIAATSNTSHAPDSMHLPKILISHDAESQDVTPQ